MNNIQCLYYIVSIVYNLFDVLSTLQCKPTVCVVVVRLSTVVHHSRHVGVTVLQYINIKKAPAWPYHGFKTLSLT